MAAIALAACGGGSGIEGGERASDVATVKVEAKPSGEPDDLQLAALHRQEHGRPTSSKATGVTVKYIEDVNDNEEFFGKMQPLLAQGQSGGREHHRRHRLDGREDARPRLRAELRQGGDAERREEPRSTTSRTRRSTRTATTRCPWQSGMTGLIVRKDLAPDVHSINDLFDPQYKGKVEMLTEMRDTVPLVMKCDGRRPEQGHRAGLARRDRQAQGRPSTPARSAASPATTTSSDMASGDVAAVIGWSGDAVQLQADNPNIEFRMPTEGCMLWSDNMVIPVGAPNPTAAEAFMNYVYDPSNQAQIAAYVNYVTPVDGVQGGPAEDRTRTWPTTR